MAMKFAITGSNGFIGGGLATHLENAGHNVVRIGRSSSARSDVSWDIKNFTIDAEALDGAKVDVIVHLAGEGVAEKKWTQAQKDEVRNSRVDGTRLLAETVANLKNKPSLFISGSAIGYYGDRDDEVLTESSTPGDDFLSGVCVDWEKEAAAISEAGIPTAIIRTGHTFDQSGSILKKLLLPFKLGIGGRLGDGKQYMSIIALSDHVRAMTYIAENNLTGVYNLSGLEPVTNAEFTKLMGKRLGRPTVLPTPLLPLRIQYGSELVDTLLLGSQRVQPKALTDAGFKFEHETVEDILKAAIR